MACKNYHYANTVTVNTTASFVQLQFSEPVTVENKDRFCFRIAEKVPAAGYTFPVYVFINGTNVPLLDKYGNTLLGSSLNSRKKKYTGYFGNAQSAHVILTNEPMSYNCGSVGNIL